MLEAFDQKVAAARESFTAAPPAPVRFERVPGEDDIIAAIAMPRGPERNTALVFLFSQLDRARTRVLERRLENPDDEDKLAEMFERVVDVRADLLGILAGTRKVRIDPRTVRLPPRGVAPSVAGPAATGPALGPDRAGIFLCQRCGTRWYADLWTEKQL